MGELPEVRREVPTFGRGTRLYLGVVTGDPVSGHDHDYSIYASCDEDGFELSTHDGGHWPVDELHSALWVEPQHVPDLVQALGGEPGDDPVELLARQMGSGGVTFNDVCTRIREHGVPYAYDMKTVSNL